jgi:hypothetical protein
MGNCYQSNCDPCTPDSTAINQLVRNAANYARQSQTYSVDSANSATNAQTIIDQGVIDIEAILNEFETLYLGAKSSDPTTDNEGNPLQVGALYWNTSTNQLKLWTGTIWILAAGFNEFTNFLATGTSASRNLVTRTSDVLNLKDFGAVGNGSADDRPAIILWLNQIEATGKPGFIPSGTYRVSTGIQHNITKNHNITAATNATLVNSIGMTTSILRFVGNGSTQLVWNGGKFDASFGTYVPGAGSSTCLSLNSISKFSISDTYFYGGILPYSSSNADSGITWVNCNSGSVTSCWFEGFADIGVYPSGGSVDGGTDNTGDSIISSCYFNNCSNGINAKRECTGLIISKNIFNKCSTAIATSEALSGVDWFKPGERGVISENIFQTCVTGLRLNWTKNWLVSNNVFHDMGYDSNGLPIDGVGTNAIRVAGSENCIISTNWFGFSGATPALNRMISFQTYTANKDGLDKYSVNNFVTGNIFINAVNGARELSSNDGPNFFESNYFENCTEDLVLGAPGSGTTLHRRISINFPNILAQEANDQTVTLTGARPGDSIFVNPVVASNAGLTYDAYVSADNTVTVTAKNYSALPIDQAPTTFIIQAFHSGI